MSFKEARENVLQALTPLGQDYVSIVRQGLTSKEEGGYALADISTYMQPLYLLIIHSDDIDDAFTLAHELGHSMHSYYSDHSQPHNIAYCKMVVAEIVLIMNEMLLHEYLMQKALKEQNKQMELFLINKLTEMSQEAIIRQTQFAEFERDLHKIAIKGEALTPNLMSSLFRRLNLRIIERWIQMMFVSDSCADRDYYQVLGVNRGASREDIKRAYKDLSMKFHPDKVKTGNADEAQKKYSEINNAYEVLYDEKKRGIYDSQGEDGIKRMGQGQDNPFGNFQNPFQSFFTFNFGDQGDEHIDGPNISLIDSIVGGTFIIPHFIGRRVTVDRRSQSTKEGE
ncbi:MAG: putative oligoendopeptidase F, partial [Streblomastix strix]